MKLTSLTLLVLFGTLLCVQLACAAGCHVHGECSTASSHHDHDAACTWDPCRQSLDTRTTGKRLEATADAVPAIVDPDDWTRLTPQSRPIASPASTGNSFPRPAGSFPLLN